MSKLFVWDFHGTLEEGNEKSVTVISNMALEKLGFKERFNDQESESLYGRKWYEYFEYLLPRENQTKHLELQELAFDLSVNNPEIIIGYIRPARNSKEVLEIIGQKHRQILISNTNQRSLEMFVKAVGFEKFFDQKNTFATDGHGIHKTNTKQTQKSTFFAYTWKTILSLMS